MHVKLNGEMVYFWRAVDHEGEVLESYVTKKREKSAALTFMKKALKRHGKAEVMVTDGLKSYPAAMRELGNPDRREMGRWDNNRAENSHLPFRRRERAMLRLRRMKTLQKFASVHANVHNQLAAPPFGSIVIATSSIAKHSKNAVRPRRPSGNRSPPEPSDQSPICIVERRVRARLTAPNAAVSEATNVGSVLVVPTFCSLADLAGVCG
ncbi:transposase [Sphingomonas sp.]|uniref:transposase n=1 Tax=Sphingomonas sp. TaxID=28214 RepID=UPI0035A8C916